MVVLAGSQIFINDLTNKVGWAGFSLTHAWFLKCEKTTLNH
jgi:hypothetical protein